MPHSIRYTVMLPFMLSLAASPALSATSDILDKWESLDKEHKLLYTNIGGALAITAWGFANWDYGERSPHAESEGWFGADTKTGGADKLGHVYTGYVTGRTLSHLYENWGYPEDKAKVYGALSSFGLFGLMELGDSFSPTYGFSHEDFIMNGVGSYLGYLLDTRPALARKLDLRIEYKPGGGGSSDIFTDYENSKYLVALKLDGFDSVHHELLRYLELHAGYYTRGFEVPGNIRERNFYLGIGFNFSRLAQRHSFKRTATFLHYFQLPETEISAKRKFDH